MEDNNNNKKKRNNKKKNKNKQTKTTEDDAVGVDHQNGIGDEPSNAADVDGFDRHQNNGSEISISMEAEKQQWVQREAILEETINQLRNENDLHIQKEVILRKSIKQLQEENDIHRQNQVTLEETVRKLGNENDSALKKNVTLEESIKELRNANYLSLQKEVTSEETIKELRNANDSALQKEATFKEAIQKLKIENDSQMQKEAGLEKNIAQLQSEKDLCLQKEAVLEEKLQRSLDENAVLGLKGACLEEKIKQLESDKHSWTLTENTNKETIARMNVDITRLRMQVVELEESRNSLLKENQQLMGNISDLRLQLQNFETNISSSTTSDELKKRALERENLDSQIEAACALVDKLITENAELVEKVNELYIKLDRQNSAAVLSSAIGNGVMPSNAEITPKADFMPESSENMPVAVHKLESMEVEPTAGLPYSADADTDTDTGEIEQIPLDDNELADLELQAVESDKTEAVPISDAPLIGAPFRLISFVAKYVSGADLVDQDASNLV